MHGCDAGAAASPPLPSKQCCPSKLQEQPSAANAATVSHHQTANFSGQPSAAPAVAAVAPEHCPAGHSSLMPGALSGLPSALQPVLPFAAASSLLDRFPGQVSCNRTAQQVGNVDHNSIAAHPGTDTMSLPHLHKAGSEVLQPKAAWSAQMQASDSTSQLQSGGPAAEVRASAGPQKAAWQKQTVEPSGEPVPSQRADVKGPARSPAAPPAASRYAATPCYSCLSCCVCLAALSQL